ncbi:NAD(P)-dependent oxidoreductase [Sulfolobales archaeon HS-7]|nr:NAD(P)-dependent oxidoreductase [Sulfolobales archaeon HS-7]
MEYLIIGSGQLGSSLRKIIPEAAITYRSGQVEGGLKLDVLNTPLLEDLILKLRPKVIINAVAMTDVDRCEIDKKTAMQTNGFFVRNLVRIAKVIEAYLVHFSTDYVFDGEKGMYKEDDLPNPINYYGVSKLIGDAFATSYDDALIVRTSGVFSHKGFPVKVIENAKKGEVIKALRGFYSPIHAELLAQATYELIKQRRTGIINVAGDRISRYELAKRIGEALNLKVNVVEVDNIQSLIAKRPYDSSLDTSLVKKYVDVDLSIDESLRLMSRAHPL